MLFDLILYFFPYTQIYIHYIQYYKIHDFITTGFENTFKVVNFIVRTTFSQTN